MWRCRAVWILGAPLPVVRVHVVFRNGAVPNFSRTELIHLKKNLARPYSALAFLLLSQRRHRDDGEAHMRRADVAQIARVVVRDYGSPLRLGVVSAQEGGKCAVDLLEALTDGTVSVGIWCDAKVSSPQRARVPQNRAVGQRLTSSPRRPGASDRAALSRYCS